MGQVASLPPGSGVEGHWENDEGGGLKRAGGIREDGSVTERLRGRDESEEEKTKGKI